MPTGIPSLVGEIEPAGSTNSDVCTLVHDGQNVLFASTEIANFLSLDPSTLSHGAPVPMIFTETEELNENSLERQAHEAGWSLRSETVESLTSIVFQKIRNHDLGRTFFEKTSGIMAQGLMIHDREQILWSNSKVAEMLDLPTCLVDPGRNWLDMVRFAVDRGDYGDSGGDHIKSLRQNLTHGGPVAAERRVGNKVIAIAGRYDGGLGVVTYTDVTDAREREKKLIKAETRARYLAEYDGLTGLLNRRRFDEAMLQMLDDWHSGRLSCKKVAVILLDLDRFKAVNDSQGHAAGDALLKELSMRFGDVVSDGDLAARVGGDEFAFAVPCLSDNDAFELAERLQTAATEQIMIDGVQSNVGASIGIALSQFGDDSSDLKIGADLALYKAKREGRGKVVLFDVEIAEEERNRREFERDLRTASERGELEMHYQVQHELHSNQAVGYEALMRWQHPIRGAVSPEEFIPIAEEIGLISEMGRWALIQSCSDIAGLDSTSRVSVNVSPVQFMTSDLVEDIISSLKVSGLDPSRLEIEVTETVMIKETEKTLETMEAIAALGVAISLDDFGSGYSSLSYLTQFPFSKIKIDKTFIASMHNDRRSEDLVRSIFALANALDLKVTAEGVETQRQFTALVKECCDEVQGYLLGKPVSYAELKERETDIRSGMGSEKTGSGSLLP
ncbi:EAL domain-containing protein [uncultured Roseobacter sp.]|uniref:putative bifunctional diguanylate cyclase/phosphodiesterase n=1 Tax=uncultured Roseobacter sp. TaxID=114847 RepID=UPI0026165D8B|nr:EAL domain-containing protein [uncultured Roseobacter sp.]